MGPYLRLKSLILVEFHQISYIYGSYRFENWAYFTWLHFVQPVCHVTQAHGFIMHYKWPYERSWVQVPPLIIIFRIQRSGLMNQSAQGTNKSNKVISLIPFVSVNLASNQNPTAAVTTCPGRANLWRDPWLRNQDLETRGPLCVLQGGVLSPSGHLASLWHRPGRLLLWRRRILTRNTEAVVMRWFILIINKQIFPIYLKY